MSESAEKLRVDKWLLHARFFKTRSLAASRVKTGAVRINGTVTHKPSSNVITGDVLTGMIGAFLARGMEAWDAARLAVFVHGDAGDRAAAVVGHDGLIAGDLLSKIPESMNALLRGDSPPRW